MILNTKRTICTPLTTSSIDDLMDMYQEQDSFKFIAPHKDKDLSYYEAFIQRNIDANKKEVAVWVVHQISGPFIGTINLNYSEAIQGVQIGCHLRRAFWKQGYASELMTELVRYAFENAGLPEVGSIYETRNQASAKLMKMLQFDIKEKKMEGEIEVTICQRVNPT